MTCPHCGVYKSIRPKFKSELDDDVVAPI